MEEYKQQTEYTCGVSCCRYILYKFKLNGAIVTIPTEEELIPILGTNNKIGTTPTAIFNYFNNDMFSVFMKTNSTYEDIRTLLIDGWEIILPISIELPHYVVVENISHSHISMWDPLSGGFVSELNRKFNNPKRQVPHARWRVKQIEFDWAKNKAQYSFLNGFDFTTVQSNRMIIAIKYNG